MTNTAGEIVSLSISDKRLVGGMCGLVVGLFGWVLISTNNIQKNDAIQNQQIQRNSEYVATINEDIADLKGSGNDLAVAQASINAKLEAVENTSTTIRDEIRLLRDHLMKDDR